MNTTTSSQTVFIYRPHLSYLVFWLLAWLGSWGGLAWLALAIMDGALAGEPDRDNGAAPILGPILLIGVALVSLLGVISYFLRHRVEVGLDGLHFSGTWDFVDGYVPYEIVQQVRRTMLGGVEVRYRAEEGFWAETRSQRLPRWITWIIPSQDRRTIYLRDADEFLKELSARAALKPDFSADFPLLLPAIAALAITVVAGWFFLPQCG